jgi:UDP-glucose 4-epimerase
VKVLVTGGAGFIGSHVVARLVAEGCVVTVIDNLSTGLAENVNSAAKFIKLDIAKDDLAGIFAVEKFDFVIHQAAQTAVPKSLEAPDFDCQVNILGTVNILEAARTTGVKRVVFASSAAVYGNVAAVPIAEGVSTKPTSFYGLSKLTVEKYLELYYSLFGLEYVTLRYANVYGERQGDAGEGGVISVFARRYQQGKALIIYGDGGQTRDFVYAGDVADANWLALTAARANAAYNISTATETSVNQLADLMAGISGKTIAREYQPAREGDICRSSLDNQAAAAGLGWRPQTLLAEGLAATYRSLQN